MTPQRHFGLEAEGNFRNLQIALCASPIVFGGHSSSFDKAEAAYRRGDLFEKRRKLMEAWQALCESKPMAKVLPLKR